MFIAQMLNYQNTSAINFKKGCYTGQEIVARTHYKGSIKRKLFKLSLNANIPLKVGDELFIKKEEHLKSMAIIAAACLPENDQQNLLVVSNADILTLKTIHTQTEQELRITNAQACK
jgi:hypothetical protein